VNTPRETAAKLNPFICQSDIHGTAANVAAGLSFLSYAVGCAHEANDEEMANGLDIIMRTMSKALTFENQGESEGGKL
jgi:hypothetical protein